MNFNPLFMSSASSVSNNSDGTKESKFTNSNYLFANIINVSKENLTSIKQNVVIDEKNKSLFSNLKSDPQSSKQVDSSKNNFVTDITKLSTFLSNVLERKSNTTKLQLGEFNENKNSDLSAIPEQVVSIINALNVGEKISIPVMNNGKNVFVEVKKADAQSSPKIITLASKEISELKFSDLDLDKVVSDISNNLTEILPQITPSVSNEKINAIVAEVENSFENLIAVNDNAFKPQTNVLGNLISNIEKKIDLSAVESANVKNTIVTQFVNQIKATIDVKTSDELKSKEETLLVPINSIVNELNLSPTEAKVIEKFGVGRINIDELKNQIKNQLAESGKNPELQSILNKINSNYKYDNTIKLQSKTEAVAEKLPLKEITSKLNLTTNEVSALKQVTTEKISLPELSNNLKAELGKTNTPVEFKSLLQKLNKYESTIPSEKTEAVAEKLPLKEIASKLNLTTNEVSALKQVTTEKISLSELSKDLKAGVGKTNTPVEFKSLLQKLNKYESAIASEKTEAVAEKLPLKEIASKLNLTTNEVSALKQVTTEKISLSELSKELKVEAQKPFVQTEIKSLEQKVEVYLNSNKMNNLNVSFESLSKTLNLTENETNILKNYDLEKVNLKELKLALTTEIVKDPSQTEFKSLLTKMSTTSFVNKTVSTEFDGKIVNEGKLDTLPKTSSIPKNPNRIEKSIQVNGSINTNNSEVNSDYLVSIKSAKSIESVLLDSKLNLANKTPELLKTSIYASKESTEFTKLKVIPINEEVTQKNEFRLGDNNKKVMSEKTTHALNPTNSGKDNSKTTSEGNYSSTNEENVNTKLNVSFQSNIDEQTKKAFEKEIHTAVNTDNKETHVSKSEKNTTAGQTVENKINEIVFPKPSIVSHQIRNQSLVVTEKIIYKRINVENIKDEISQLMQKGEKKTVEFSLTPENLGKLQVKLEVINKVVSASIKVDNEMTQQIVQQSLDGLKSSLNQNGVLYNSLNVSLSDSEDKNNRFFKQKRKQNPELKGNIQELDEQFVHKKFGYNKYDFIA